MMGYGEAGLIVINVVEGVSVWLILLGMVLAPLLVRATAKARVATFNRINQRGRGMLDQELHVDAERAFEQVEHQFAWPSAFEQVEHQFAWPRFLPRLARYNRAMAMLKQGKLQETIDLLAEVDRAGGVLGLDAGI